MAVENERSTVRTLARGLTLLDLMADAPIGGASLSELARGLGTSKSATLALLRTLVAAGFAREIRPGPRYTLGMALVRFGDLASQKLPLGDVALPVLQELSDETGMTARVAISDGGYPVFVERVDGPGSVRFYTPLGQREVPHTSAAGKSILSTLSEDRVREICRETGLAGRTSHSITEIDVLLKELDLTRRRGFAIDDEEDATGIFCVGAPLFDHGGGCVGAISVTGIKGDLAAWRIEELGLAVQRAANRISSALGGSIDSDANIPVAGV